MSHSTTKPCDRCGRRIQINTARRRSILVCLECKFSDPEYLRLRERNDGGTAA